MRSMNGALRAPVSLAATTQIDIQVYTKRFESYPDELMQFAKDKTIPLISLSSMRGQALALMAQPEVRGQKHIRRQDAVAFFASIGMSSQDAIQAFNKCSGFKRLPMKGRYCLRFPFEADTIDLEKRKGVALPGDRDAAIQTIKEWWLNHLVNVPNDAWEIGHLDPTLNDASPANLAYQPPIQKTYRNRFKFDPFFIKMWPTAAELVPKLDAYYTDAEQRALYDALREKFSGAPVSPASQASALPPPAPQAPQAPALPPQGAAEQCQCSLD